MAGQYWSFLWDKDDDRIAELYLVNKQMLNDHVATKIKLMLSWWFQVIPFCLTAQKRLEIG